MKASDQNEAQLFGIAFSRANAEEIVQAVTGPLDHIGIQSYYTCNLDHIYNLSRNPEFRAAYEAAAVRTVDGRPLALYANLVHNLALPLVTGADLFPRILDCLRPELHRPYFVAGSEATGAALVERMQSAGFARDQMGLEVPAFGFEKDAEASSRLAHSIQEHGTTHLFFGVGSPKSEIWLYQNRHGLGNLHAFGFGAALDFAAGTRSRAPRWMQRIGLEWLYRLLGEPQRLLPRYTRNAISFVRLIWIDVFSRRS